MGTSYETDVVAWANEQAALLRSGKISEIDALHIAEEIEDVGKSEQRELASRMARLAAHLLKWHFQPERRGKSWIATVHAQREGIRLALHKTPSLKKAFEDQQWLRVVWKDAVASAQKETEPDLPATWIWSVEQILDEEFWPD